MTVNGRFALNSVLCQYVWSLATLNLAVNVVGKLYTKRTASASHGFLATAWPSCFNSQKAQLFFYLRLARRADVDRFSEFFTGTLSRNFAIEWLLKTPHLKRVATLPCEILRKSENDYVLRAVAALLKYELTYGK